MAKGKGIRRYIEILFDGAAAIRTEKQAQRALNKSTDAKQAKKNLREVEGGMDRLAATAKKVGAAIVAAFALRKIAQWSKAWGTALFSLSSGLAETRSKFETVFGAGTAEMDKFLSRFSHMAGKTRGEMEAVVGTTGSVLQSLGFTAEGSADLSRKLTELAGDMASFENLPLDDVLNRFTGAMTGQTEALKSMGFAISQVEIQKQAMLETGKTNAAQLTREEKALAIYTLLVRQAGVAVGDLERTQLSLANVSRRLGAWMREQRDSLAKELTPAFEAGAEAVSEFFERQKGGIEDAIKSVGVWVTENREAIKRTVTGILEFGASVTRAVVTGLGHLRSFVGGLQIMAVEFTVLSAQTKVWAAEFDAAVGGAVSKAGGYWKSYLSWFEGLPDWAKRLMGITTAGAAADFMLGVSSDNLAQLRADLTRTRIVAEAEIDRIVGGIQEANRAAAQSAATTSPGITGAGASEGAGGAGSNKALREELSLLEGVSQYRALSARELVRLTAIEANLTRQLESKNLALKQEAEALALRADASALLRGARARTSLAVDAAVVNPTAPSIMGDLSPALLSVGAQMEQLRAQWREAHADMEMASMSAAWAVENAFQSAASVLLQDFGNITGALETFARMSAKAGLDALAQYAGGQVMKSVAEAWDMKSKAAALYALSVAPPPIGGPQHLAGAAAMSAASKVALVSAAKWAAICGGAAATGAAIGSGGRGGASAAGSSFRPGADVARDATRDPEVHVHVHNLMSLQDPTAETAVWRATKRAGDRHGPNARG